MSKTDLHVFTDGTDTVVAKDLPDVQRVYEEHVMVKFVDEGMSLDDWEQVHDDEPIAINDYDGHGGKLTLTAKEWAARDGRCFLCSTEY
jgi:hypothetical protein